MSPSSTPTMSSIVFSDTPTSSPVSLAIRNSDFRPSEMVDGMEAVTYPIFTEMVTSGNLSSKSEQPVTCIIADGLFSFAGGVAQQIGIPLIYFETISPCGLWIHLCVPKLIEAGELPFKGDDLDARITCVPGMEGFLRRRDLSSFCRSGDPTDPLIKLILKENQ
ncbi:unnamed protein product [Ilex paraguariensis]|uniref:Uncharacterized protein n=1 Tax=Ilex paraguariensis TaxID=185542 RepID=A0ABC8T5D1_9AQUA